MQRARPLGTILIADADPGVRASLEPLLRLQGYRVLTAENGVEALALSEEQPVDLALLDVGMPPETALSVCRTLKSRCSSRRGSIVLMGQTGAQNRIRGIRSGADDFLSKPIRREELLFCVQSLLGLEADREDFQTAEAVLFRLAGSMEARDPYTAGHCERVSRYSAGLAEQIGLADEERLALRRGGMIHDIGKLAVPDQILLKPGPLSPDERRVMERHTLVGEQICAPLKSLGGILPMIRSHHEHQNGSGYPDRLRGNQIPLTARILQIADVYDALTTDRPYRSALPPGQALDTVRREAARGWWDREIVEQLASFLKNASGLPVSPKAYRAKVAKPRRLAASLA